jgi:hypothetical protein
VEGLNVTAESAHLPSVLVIAADPGIEALAGELVAFAGYRPIFDVTSGAAGESLRRLRPDVVLVDTALPMQVTRACTGAAAETGASVVLMSSTASADELAGNASAEHCLHFVLPGGPRQLGAVIERALDQRRVGHATRRRSAAPIPGSVHPALCAALANVARARVLGARATMVRVDAQVLRAVRADIVEETRRTRDALRAAVADYARQLRRAEVSEDEALIQVQDTIAECASFVGARSEVEDLLSDAEAWIRSAYRAA